MLAKIERVHFAGVPFVPVKRSEAKTLIISEAKAKSGRGHHVHLVNAYSISLTLKMPSLLEVYNESNAVCLADGKSVSFVSGLLSWKSRVSQVRGPSLFSEMLAEGSPDEVRHYLVGGSPAVLEALAQKILANGISLVGWESPPYRQLTLREQLDLSERITRSQADIVWVGLGTPKQDMEAARLANELPVLAIAVGAAFDYLAGALTESPKWIQAIGFEWFFRLMSEPQRLWRRYTLGNIDFLRAVALRHWSAK